MTGHARSPLVAGRRPSSVPLSFAQQRLWFLARRDGPRPADNLPFLMRLSGELDLAALRAAMHDVVARYEVLRTVFPSRDGVPHQVILDVAGEVAVRAATEDTVRDELARAASHGFDLTSEPPFRAELFVLGPTEHVLSFVVHRISADERSVPLVLRALARAYTARRAGGVPEWPQPVQYADYTLWQRERLGSAAESRDLAARQLEHWRTVLDGMPVELALPVDRSGTRRGRWVDCALSPELHDGLVALAATAGTSVFVVVQAALAAVLSRLGAGSDIPIGSTVAGRGDEALDEMVGLLANTVVSRTDTSGAPTFLELVARVRRTVLAAHANQDVPFEWLADLTRHPLCQVFLNLRDCPEPTVEMPGLTATLEPGEPHTARFDLEFDLVEHFGVDGTPQGITGEIRYSTDLFDEPTVERLRWRLGRLIEAVLASPTSRITDFELLHREEVDRLAVESRGAVRDLPAQWESVPRRFARQVAATPDAIALVHEDTALSYRELDERANRLAHRLVGAGVGRESRVAVLHRRSVDLVVSLLAVLKAGGAYVPMDERAPRARWAHVVAQAAASVLLTDRQAGELDLDGTQVIHPATDVGLASCPTTDPEVWTHPEQLAYVMFTSGSTGEPKGVMVTHRDLLAFALDGGFDARAHHRVLLHAPHSFDVLNYELWTPLLRGGQVVVCPAVDMDVTTLRRMLTKYDITGLHLTAGLFRVVVETDLECLAGVRELLAGGDVVPADSVRRLLDRFPDLVFKDTYGPTETTTFATYFRASPAVSLPDTVPIGRPLDNMSAHVLDAGLRRVPPGVAGELHIAGDGVARGYRGAPALTAVRFVPDPYGPAGGRLYRTGDLARRTPGGDLVFLGRTDNQVKIRGFRVEPGDIEAAAARVPGIAQAVVTAHENPSGDKVLVAFVVPAPGHVVDGAAVLTELAAHLPDYMVPAAVLPLSSLPLTPNGKVDRRALPEPRLAAGGEHDNAPGDDLEERIRGVVATVLKLPEVPLDAHFSRLGADSLTFMRIAFAATKQGVEMSVKDIFRAPTVLRLAELLRAR